MHHRIYQVIFFILPIFVATCFATDPYLDPIQSYSYWNEDSGGGGGSYLGIDTRDVTAERLAVLHMKEERGVEVTMVDQDAPAGKAGIQEQDVLLSINGEAVQSVEQLRRMIHEIPPGRTATVELSRHGQPLTLKVQLANRRDFALTTKEFKFAMPQPAIVTMPEIDVPVSIVVVHSSDRSGLMVENLTPQLADFFGTKEGRGILVRSVEKGSFAERAGFHAGDVITQINGEPVSDSGDFAHALRNRKGNTVNIVIVRGKKEQTITFTLPEPRRSGEYELGIPKIGAELHDDLFQAEAELAQIKPEMEALSRELTREMQRIKPEILLQNKEIEHQLKEQKNQFPWVNPEKLQEQFRQQWKQVFGHQADI